MVSRVIAKGSLPRPTYHTLVVKGDCSHGHIASLLDVTPRRVDDRLIVAPVTLYTVGLDKLAAIVQERLWYLVPLHALRQAEVHVC